ncbi:MAG TPA: hypothetical protein VFZ04_04050 [Longimicrobiales bacterium]
MSRKKMIVQALVLAAFAGATAMCSKDDLEEESQEVIDAQREAAEVAEENPQDTAAIREAGREVIEEQREAADKMREELRERGLDTLQTTTRQ